MLGSHILHFLHFTDNNKNGVDRTDDRLWKIRDLYEILRTNFSKFYNPSEHLAVDEVIVKFNGRVLFKQNIPKKMQTFWHQNVQTMLLYWIFMT